MPLTIPTDPAEQRAIAGVQEAVEVEGELVRVSREFKQAALKKLFTEGLRGEPPKQTDIGLVPQSWDMAKIGDLGKVVTGSTPPTKNKDFYEGGQFDFIAPGDLSGSTKIRETVKHRTGCFASASQGHNLLAQVLERLALLPRSDRHLISKSMLLSHPRNMILTTYSVS